MISCLAQTIHRTWNGHALPASEQIRFEIERRPKGLLIDFEAPFYDDPAPLAPVGPTDGLWEHEVFELFIACQTAEGALETYTEIELGPYGHYLVLCLAGRRQAVSKLHELRYKVYRSPGRWMGTALIPWELLPPSPWNYNAYAIHGQGATRTYQACFPVPGQAPDFHQLQYFQPLAWAN
ncbi:MAG: hypothetical protein CVV27_16705 [Candidatus Melainabacteria bacterium HGW-Melainabacteria-1]|nr:MAG: hypothetical protein CVV27_16705 [Candidatus Melainabacteria bacterium HGW-Melainabacteria-1]